MVMGSYNTLSMTLACKRHVIPDVCTCNQPLRISTFGYHPCLSFTRISINQVLSSPLLPLQLTSGLVLFHNLSSCSDLEFRILSLCPHAWLYFCCRFPHLSLHVMIWHVSSSLANLPFDVSDSSLHDLKNETLIMVHDGSGGILSMGGMQGGRSRRGGLTRSAPMFCLYGDGGATSNHD